jgi:UDP-glucose 4-epimerase
MNILEAAKLSDVKRIVYASSSEVYGSALTTPMNEDHPLGAEHLYGCSKIAAERMCYSYYKTFGLPITIARPYNTFGKFQKDSGYGGVIGIFTRRTLMGLPCIIYGSGEQRRDYLFIQDGLEAYDCLLKKDCVGQVFNFGTGRSLSINEIAGLVLKECGREDLVPVHVEGRPNEVQNLVADASKAKRLLGWKPKVKFEDGLKRYVDWFKNFRGEEWKIS